MFFKCENDCSHAYVEPNMVNTAICAPCSVWYVAGSPFQVLTINWPAGWSFFVSVQMQTKFVEGIRLYFQCLAFSH